MAQAETALSAWSLLIETDLLTKLILLSLFIASVICGAIAIFKIIYFAKENRQVNALTNQAFSARSLEDFISSTTIKTTTNTGNLVTSLLNELRRLLRLEADGRIIGNLSDTQLDQLAAFGALQIDIGTNEIERYLPFLSISAVVSPLVGLFGTVWGIIISFMSISSQRSVDLAVIAPGLAAALITTLAGLIVAIPALIFYQYFANQARNLENTQHALISRVLLLIAQSVRS